MANPITDDHAVVRSRDATRQRRHGVIMGFRRQNGVGPVLTQVADEPGKHLREIQRVQGLHVTAQEQSQIGQVARREFGAKPHVARNIARLSEDLAAFLGCGTGPSGADLVDGHPRRQTIGELSAALLDHEVDDAPAGFQPGRQPQHRELETATRKTMKCKRNSRARVRGAIHQRALRTDKVSAIPGPIPRNEDVEISLRPPPVNDSRSPSCKKNMVLPVSIPAYRHPLMDETLQNDHTLGEPTGGPIDVLFFLHNFAGGGVEKKVLRLAAMLKQRGRRVAIAVCFPDGPLAESVADGIPVVPSRRGAHVEGARGRRPGRSRRARRLAATGPACPANRPGCCRSCRRSPGSWFGGSPARCSPPCRT